MIETETVPHTFLFDEEDNEVRVGDFVVYAGRRGSSCWMTLAKVKKVYADGTLTTRGRGNSRNGNVKCAVYKIHESFVKDKSGF